MAVEEEELPAAARRPQTGRLRAGSHEPASVRAEPRPVDDVEMSLEYVQAPRPTDRPDPRVVVAARRDDELAVGAERRGREWPPGPAQHPDTGSRVRAAPGQAFPCRRSRASPSCRRSG